MSHPENESETLRDLRVKCLTEITMGLFCPFGDFEGVDVYLRGDGGVGGLHGKA